MNVKLDKSELKILSCLLFERESEMRSDLSDKDGKVYLEICGLKGKINGYLELIEYDEEDEDSHWDIRIQNLRKACKIWEGVK